MKPNALKAAAWSALWTFISLFGLSLVGFLSQLAEWASKSDATPLPSINPLGKAFVAAAVAAVSGVITFIVRFAQEKGSGLGTPPAFPSNTPE